MIKLKVYNSFAKAVGMPLMNPPKMKEKAEKQESSDEEMQEAKSGKKKQKGLKDMKGFIPVFTNTDEEDDPE